MLLLLPVRLAGLIDRDVFGRLDHDAEAPLLVLHRPGRRRLRNGHLDVGPAGPGSAEHRQLEPLGRAGASFVRRTGGVREGLGVGLRTVARVAELAVALEREDCAQCTPQSEVSAFACQFGAGTTRTQRRGVGTLDQDRHHVASRKPVTVTISATSPPLQSRAKTHSLELSVYVRKPIRA